MTVSPTSEGFPATARFGRDYLASSIASIFGASGGEISCAALAGDASDRRYFRADFSGPADRDGKKSVIIMQLQDPVAGEDPDFIRVLRFLRGLDLPVPDLLFHDREKGLLFLEDCGASTLEDRIRKRPGETGKYYREAVELLSRLHSRATGRIGPDCPAYHLRFDVKKLMWEFDFMLEHYVGGLHRSPCNPDAAREVREHFQALCETLAAQPLWFTHRDYHSRNLMASDRGLMILDFQDARMGPCQYDLASLLKDSYVRLDSDLRNELIELFVSRMEEDSGEKVDRPEFYRIFDWMAIQRNLKAIGTFAYQSVVKKNDRYLEYIPLTLEYVKQTLDDRSDLGSLGAILRKTIPGLNHPGC